MAHKRQPTRDDDDALNEDGASNTPLHKLPGFGTGLHRQRVAFVRAGEAPPAKGSPPVGSLPGGAVSDLYLSIVMGETKTTETTAQKTIGKVEAAVETVTDTPTATTSPAPACDICSLPLTTASSAAAHYHETCLVHQVALDHSKPPSALDRGRFGLTIMSAQGWDPDSGRGLGADQQGMAYPIEVKLRPDRQALGNDPGPSSSASSSKRPAGSIASAPAPSRNRQYSRKQLRHMEEDRRRRHDRLREQIMGNKDLDKYLRLQGDE